MACARQVPSAVVLLGMIVGAGCGDRRLTTLRAGPDAAPPVDCVGLQCRQPSCTSGACVHPACPAGISTTSVSGTLFDPAGQVPLFGGFVYVPNAPLTDLPTGASCDRCDAPVSGQPIAATLTDARGAFRLDNVPFGPDVPLVFQIGKWRRQVTVASVPACTNTPLPTEMTRLPRNQSEGHLPKIAVATGDADALECLLRKIGISDAEFSTESGAGRVHLYAGFHGTPRFDTALNGGAAFTPASALWSHLETLRQYDIVILSCEGTYHEADNKTPEALLAMRDYANAGGRIFASHWHMYWLENGPAPLPDIATFATNLPDLADPFTAAIDTSFPKGRALADWLAYVSPGLSRGELVINSGQHTIQAVVPSMAQRWVYSDATSPPSVQCFSANAPVGAPAAEQCGRMVFTDIHVSSGQQSSPELAFPAGCDASPLSPQEKALEFMLFEVSSCLRMDAEQPGPPVL